MKVPVEVYELLGVDPEPKDNPWPGSTKSFYDIPYENIKKVAEILGEEFLEDAQNYSPKAKEFLDDLASYQHCTYFDGYIVSPRRDDERVSIEGVTTARSDENILRYRHADDFEFVDDGLLHVWWD